MKILFIGSVIFSKVILEKLYNNYDIVGVCTKKKSIINSDFYNLSKVSKKFNIPYIFTNNINSNKTFHWIKKKKPDLIICCGWSQIIKKKILKIPLYGSIGYHPADLPNNRGRSPIIWSIFLGLKKCSSTFFLMNELADSGKVLSKKNIKIFNSDNATSIYKKLNLIASKQIINVVKKIKYLKKNKIKNKIKKTNFWRKRTLEDGKIDWRMSATKIDKLIKSLTFPYPYAHFIFKNKIIKVYEAKILKSKKYNIEPGKVFSKFNNNFVVKCGEDALVLKGISPKIKLKVNSYI